MSNLPQIPPTPRLTVTATLPVDAQGRYLPGSVQVRISCYELPTAHLDAMALAAMKALMQMDGNPLTEKEVAE